VLYGIEEWYIEQAAKAITNRALQGTDDSLLPFNLIEVDARATSIARLMQELTTPPFMVSAKVVRVENCPYFAPRQSKGARKADAETEDEPREDLAPLAGLLGTFPRGVTLICEAATVDMRSSLANAVKKHGAIRNFSYQKRADALRDAQAVLSKELHRLGLSIQPRASAELLQLIGVDEKTPHLRQLWQEIAKLTAYKGYSGVIGVEDVVALTPRSAEAKVFLVTDALSQKNKATALRHVRQLWQDGEEPLMVLAMLARHIRQLLLAREMLDEGLSADEVAKALGGHPFVTGKVVAASRTFDPARLREMLVSCFDIDNKGKSGRADIAFALERLIVTFACT